MRAGRHLAVAEYKACFLQVSQPSSSGIYWYWPNLSTLTDFGLESFEGGYKGSKLAVIRCIWFLCYGAIICNSLHSPNCICPLNNNTLHVILAFKLYSQLQRSTKVFFKHTEHVHYQDRTGRESRDMQRQGLQNTWDSKVFSQTILTGVCPDGSFQEWEKKSMTSG